MGGQGPEAPTPHPAGFRPAFGRAIRRPARTGIPLPALLLAAFALLACAGSAAPPPTRPPATVPPASDAALLDDLAERTFRFFWETAHPRSGLTPDRWPTRSFASVAAMGFGLTAYAIGAERGFVSREAARDRTLAALRFVAGLPQGPEPRGRAGYRGFFYHFLDPETGLRFEKVELSTMDTALLLAGALSAAGYFDRDEPAEREIRETAEALYRRVEWPWAQERPPLLAMGWHPETGFIEADWRGYNEGMLVYLLALGSPTHPIAPEAWEAWARTYRLLGFQGQSYVAFAPLFGHHYTHVFVDFRGIRDAPMRRLGLDYFENSRRAALAQRAWAIANPRGWRGLGPGVWGITACDGPIDAELPYEGEKRRFFTYAGRGVGADFVLDDGTIAPTGAAASLPFVPAEATAAVRALREGYGEHLYSTYGFRDALNPSFRFADVTLRHGRVVPGVGWFDTDHLGIDQGPILAMLENHRSGLVWRVLRGNPHLVRGLERAGFSGGWLEAGRR
jgi:hypothetical protein